ncbi:MAG: helix-turn-helix domain-containing protein [Candidatus Omnitrophica bacterium]|nr:helix-turn-helix domain-containing protein [Candidatus Omnitrophota bacterium]
MGDFMTVQEIAAKVRKATKTIYHYVETEVIPANLIIRVGNSIRMRPSDFEKWIEGQRGR